MQACNVIPNNSVKYLFSDKYLFSVNNSIYSLSVGNGFKEPYKLIDVAVSIARKCIYIILLFRGLIIIVFVLTIPISSCNKLYAFFRFLCVLLLLSFLLLIFLPFLFLEILTFKFLYLINFWHYVLNVLDNMLINNL